MNDMETIVRDHEKAMQRARDHISAVRQREQARGWWNDLTQTYSGTMVIVDIGQKFLDPWTWKNELRYQLRRLFWA